MTAKIRLGYEDRQLLQDNSQAIAAAGADELAIHARTKVDGYRAPAWWDEVARVREWVDLPVVANGEIWSPQDARRCQQDSGCEDLMLGRGALSRPDLSILIRQQLCDTRHEVAALDWGQVRALVLQYFDLMQLHYAPRYLGNPIKQWLVYLRIYFPQAAALFDHVKRLRDPQQIREALRLSY